MDEETRLKAYYSLFRDNDWGVNVLTDLMDKFYKPTFITGNVNADALLLNAGGREVIVYILAQIEEFERRGRG